MAPTNLFFPSIYYNYAAHESHHFCCLVSSVFHYNTNLSIQYHACLVAILARWNGFLTGKYRLTSHVLIEILEQRNLKVTFPDEQDLN